MIFLFIIFVNLLPFHGPLEASETDIHEDDVEPDPRGSVALEGHGKNFQVDADGQTKTAKEIGEDFAESGFSMSTYLPHDFYISMTSKHRRYLVVVLS